MVIFIAAFTSPLHKLSCVCTTEVISGKENVLKFYNNYGDKLGYKQDSIFKFGNKFLREKYPKVDYIIKGYLLKTKK